MAQNQPRMWTTCTVYISPRLGILYTYLDLYLTSAYLAQTIPAEPETGSDLAHHHNPGPPAYDDQQIFTMESRGGAKRQRIRYTETYGYDNAAEKRGVRFLGPSPVSQDHLTDSERITTSQCECCHSTMPRSVSSRTDSSTSTLVHDFLNDDHHKSLRTSIPPGLASCNGTYTYHQALQHRIVFDRLQPGSDLDPDVYTPVFLHDTLMLPGSLAQLIGKVHALGVLSSHVTF